MTILELVGKLHEQLFQRGNLEVLIMPDDLPITGLDSPEWLCQIRLVEFRTDEQGGFVVLES